jgi:hypothetical protein
MRTTLIPATEVLLRLSSIHTNLEAEVEAGIYTHVVENGTIQAKNSSSRWGTDKMTMRHPPSDFLTEVKECRLLPDKLGSKSTHLPHCGSHQKQQAPVMSGGALRIGMNYHAKVCTAVREQCGKQYPRNTT